MVHGAVPALKRVLPLAENAILCYCIHNRFYMNRGREQMHIKDIAALASALKENVSKVMIGKEYEIELVLTAMLSAGHVLLEDVPGTGKTTLAKALAKSLTCSFARVQFTPDLLPADVTGMRVYNQHKAEFSFAL